MRRSFHKMHGLGNDFVILDGREDPIEITAELARAIADRRSGIGCDQLILLAPGSSAELAMRIWNADGGEVESCGNAARCVVALTGAKQIETPGGLLDGAADGDAVTVTLPPPSFDWQDIPLAYAMDTRALPMAWDDLERPFAVNVGNPHLVFFVDDLESVPLGQSGPAIERDPLFPDRINVNVAEVDGKRLKLQTFERGTGLTRACGTGACASAVAAISTRRLESPVTVAMEGGNLTIDWTPGGPIQMTGGATHVFSGEIDLEALA